MEFERRQVVCTEVVILASLVQMFRTVSRNILEALHYYHHHHHHVFIIIVDYPIAQEIGLHVAYVLHNKTSTTIAAAMII